jgi:hypothetical protein
MIAAVFLTGSALVAVRAAPSPGEPDVHDRQLDVILALPLLAAAVWLELGWPRVMPLAEALNNRGVLAVTLFLAGTSLVLLGTRLTARLRAVLCLPLLGLPLFTERPVLHVVLVAAVLAGVVLASAQQVRRCRNRGLLGVVSGQSQKLPRLQTAAIAVGMLALSLGFLPLATASSTSCIPSSAPACGPLHLSDLGVQP